MKRKTKMKLINSNSDFASCSSLLLLLSPIAAQQAPAYDKTPFTNDYHKTNLCGISKERGASGETLRNALQGLQLNVGIIDHQDPSFLNLVGVNATLDENDPGLFAVLLDELASRAGFTWRESFGQILPPHHELNEGRMVDDGVGGKRPVTWTDILVDAVERYDFSFGEWVHNLHRRKLGIGFPEGWYDASTILIQSGAGLDDARPQFVAASFLKPFSNRVWALILAVILVSGVAYWLLDVIISGKKRTITGADFFFQSMAFTQHHVEWNPSTHAQRIFSFSLSFWALIMASACECLLFLFSAPRADFLSIINFQTHSLLKQRHGQFGILFSCRLAIGIYRNDPTSS